MFNADDFLSKTVKGASSTSIKQPPVGEFLGMIEDVSAQSGMKDDNVWTRVDCKVSFTEEEVVSETGRDPTYLTYSFFLDLDDEGSLDMSEGKNVRLGRLREAVGQNDPKKPWSFSDLRGASARFLITHRLDDEGNTQANIRKVRADT